MGTSSLNYLHRVMKTRGRSQSFIRESHYAEESDREKNGTGVGYISCGFMGEKQERIGGEGHLDIP